MSFCKFSSEYLINSSTNVDNAFINNFMPQANAVCVKVYLYGLLKCGNSSAYDNNICSIARELGISEEDVENAFYYWKDEGLVQIIQGEPFEVVYLSPSKAVASVKKFNKDKYSDFNANIEQILQGRSITLAEYNQYYEFMEVYHFEPSALLLVAKYCVTTKKTPVSYSYILTVAKNWASENIVTYEKVEEKLKEIEQNSSSIGELFSILGIKRVATFEEREYLSKWQNKLDYNFETLCEIAKLIKKRHKKAPTMEKLDTLILKYYEMKLYTIDEIVNYEDQKDLMYQISKNVCRELGLYYENLEPVITNYTSKWLLMGYGEEVLNMIANFCFKNSIKTLDGMNSNVNKFFKLGITTSDALNEYFETVLAEDDNIKQILIALNISRNVNKYDRDFYKIWTYDWGFKKEIIDEGISFSKDKISPMQYLNKILSYWHTNNVVSVGDCKKFPFEDFSKTKKSDNFIKHDYSKEQLNALFDNLDEIDL